MKVSCLQENLARGLGIVGRAVASRSTLPVLSNILVATENNLLRLSATNLELGITCWIGAKVEEEGETTIPAKTFIDLVNTLPPSQVDMTLAVRTQTLNVTCGAFNNDIKCIDAQEFPILPSAETNNAIELNADDLRDMISQVVFAAATDDARPILTGVEVKIDGEQITFAAADGFRLAVRHSSLPSNVANPVTAIIPARTLAELARIGGDQSEPVIMTLPPHRGQVIFRLKNVEVVSQLIEGMFPDYEQLVPRGHKTRAVISTADFRTACRAADIFARESAHTTRLKFMPGNDVSPGTIEVHATSAETGSNETIVDANVEGEPIEIAFNVRYLVDVLNVVNTDNVVLETNGSASPGVIRAAGRDDFLSVIMPMHIGQ
ncbi:MAG: DNA polymerase III subunit beta [Anaerolineales bacterium]